MICFRSLFSSFNTLKMPLSANKCSLFPLKRHGLNQSFLGPLLFRALNIILEIFERKTTHYSFFYSFCSMKLGSPGKLSSIWEKRSKSSSSLPEVVQMSVGWLFMFALSLVSVPLFFRFAAPFFFFLLCCTGALVALLDCALN